jgi:hypothetical protein
MEITTTIPEGTTILSNHPRLHSEIRPGILTQDFNPGDTYLYLIYADSIPYPKPLILTHRNNLLRILPTPDRNYSNDRNLDTGDPMTDPTPTPKTKTRTRKTRSKTLYTNHLTHTGRQADDRTSELGARGTNLHP